MDIIICLAIALLFIGAPILTGAVIAWAQMGDE